MCLYVFVSVCLCGFLVSFVNRVATEGNEAYTAPICLPQYVY